MKVTTISTQTWRAKLAGFLLIAIPFISSCTDPSDMGLILDPNADRIGVFYAEIPLSAYLVSIDSLNTTNTGTLVAGGDNSPFFGRTEATAYSRLSFNVAAERPDPMAILDSAKFSLNIGSLTADNLEEAKTFSAYKLTEPILDTTYYNFSQLAYEDAPFASGSFFLEENSDTVVYMDMDEALAADMFVKLKNEEPEFSSIFNFRNYFHGFALKGDPDQETTINISLANNFTGIRLYYRDSEEDTVSSVYAISAVSGSSSNSLQSRHFNSVTNDPSGTPTAVVTEKNTAYDVGSLVGSKSLLGMTIKLNMEPLSDFLDTLGEVTFNQAVIEMGPVENYPDGKLPIPYMIPYFTDDSNKIMTRDSDGAALSIQQSRQVETDADGNVSPAVVAGGSSALMFNYEDFIYGSVLTNYVDALYRDGLMRTDLLLYPAVVSFTSSSSYTSQPSFTRSLREYVVNQNSIKLKIYYSKLK